MCAAVSLPPSTREFLRSAVTLPPPPCLKECRCGLTYDNHAWRCLPFVGYMEDGEGGWLMLRNCSCRSTLALSVRR